MIFQPNHPTHDADINHPPKWIKGQLYLRGVISHSLELGGIQNHERQLGVERKAHAGEVILLRLSQLS